MTERERKNRNASDPRLWRVAGMGFELGAGLFAFTGLGYLADRYWNTSPTWTIVGASLGVLGGGYNFIRKALEISRAAERERKEQRERNRSQH